jgi:hypothetical protein
MDHSDLWLFSILGLGMAVLYLWERFGHKAAADAEVEASGEPVRVPIEIGRITEVYRALEATGTDGSFALIAAPQTTTPGEDDPIHLQMANHGGRIGVDWVLMSDRNVAERDRFVALVTGKGYTVEERDDDVPYLRVEAAHRSPDVCIQALRELYGLRDSDPVELEAFGFRWPSP